MHGFNSSGRAGVHAASLRRIYAEQASQVCTLPPREFLLLSPKPNVSQNWFMGNLSILFHGSDRSRLRRRIEKTF